MAQWGERRQRPGGCATIKTWQVTEPAGRLEGAAIVERMADASTPVDVRYRLTPNGRALGPVLDAISRWAPGWEHRSEVFE